MRGSPHFHILLWIHDAPSFYDLHSNTPELINFIDTHISCSYVHQHASIKSQLQCQIHHHTFTCWNRRHCRFHYPIPPSQSTRILTQIPISTLTPEEINSTKNDYLLITITLQYIHTGDTITFDEFLQQTTLTEERYYKALQIYFIHRIGILYRRLPGEKMINKYNPKLFQLWQGNMDIAFVLNGHACGQYIVSYLTKNFRELSVTLKEYLRELNYNDRSPNSIQSSAMTKLITAAQVGIQEAVCFLGNKKMSVKSRAVVSIYTPKLSTVSGFRNVYTPSTLTDPLNEIDIDNILTSNVENTISSTIQTNVQHYLNRSTSIHSICLFKYLQLYYYANTG